jgi:hypothetical protein
MTLTQGNFHSRQRDLGIVKILEPEITSIRFAVSAFDPETVKITNPGIIERIVELLIKEFSDREPTGPPKTRNRLARSSYTRWFSSKLNFGSSTVFSLNLKLSA